MKTILQLSLWITLICPSALLAAGDHGHEHGDKKHADQHDHEQEKAPHDGRLMEAGEMHVEFLIGADKMATVWLYDEKLKPISPSDQTVTLILQAKDGAKNTIELTKKGDLFVSSSALTIPEGAKAILVVKAGGKTSNLRFDLDMTACGECKKPEYACGCEQ